MDEKIKRSEFKQNLERCFECRRFNTCPVVRMVIHGCSGYSKKKVSDEKNNEAKS